MLEEKVRDCDAVQDLLVKEHDIVAVLVLLAEHVKEGLVVLERLGERLAERLPPELLVPEDVSVAVDVYDELSVLV